MEALKMLRSEAVTRVKQCLLSLIMLGTLGYTLDVPSAQAIPFPLDQDGCTGGCGSGATVFGIVDVVQGADSGQVDVTVTLNSPSAFVKSGAGDALEFNIIGAPTITITNLAAGFSVGPAPDHASAFGAFDYSISCGSATLPCGPGTSQTRSGPLTFTVTKTGGGALLPTDFVANAGGYFFAADIVGPTGNSGNVAATDPPAPVPEPGSLLLFGSGLAAAGMVARRGIARRRDPAI